LPEHIAVRPSGFEAVRTLRKMRRHAGASGEE
jgi:hypothetical protein